MSSLQGWAAVAAMTRQKAGTIKPGPETKPKHPLTLEINSGKVDILNA